MTFYLDNGFFMFDGQRSIPIGDGKVDQFFLQDLNYDKSDRITSIIDPREQVVLWSYASKESVSNPDKIIVTIGLVVVGLWQRSSMRAWA